MMTSGAIDWVWIHFEVDKVLAKYESETGRGFRGNYKVRGGQGAREARFLKAWKGNQDV